MYEPLLEYRDTAASTNDVVAAWVRAGCADGKGLWVGEQTQGRGRRGRAWHAKPGDSLALSVALVGPRYRPCMLQIPIAAGVGAAEAIAGVGANVGLKWPNDLVVGDAKLGGILCEAVLDGAKFLGAVVGVGVNLRGDAAALSEALERPVATVASSGGVVDDVPAIAAAVRESIHRWAQQLSAGARAETLAAWRRVDATKGRRVVHDGRPGEAIGVDDEGALLIRRDDGSTVVVQSGEVTFG